jgi:hypothetical protein
VISKTVLEFVNNLWGLETKYERVLVLSRQCWNFRTIYGGYRNLVKIGLSYRLAAPGYIGWQNSFLEIDSPAPWKFKNAALEALAWGKKKSFITSLPSWRLAPRRLEKDPDAGGW